MRLIDPTTVEAYCRDPATLAAALDVAPYVLLDLRDPQSASPGADVVDGVGTLPCPVIALGPVAPAHAALALACDAVADTPDAAASMIDGLLRSPMAATVLVQTLRAIESLPLASALVVESLAYASLQRGAEFQRWLATRPPPPSPVDEPGPAVEIERDGDRVQLHLNRPLQRNAMTLAMRDALVEALQWIRADDSVAVLSIDARGRCFSTGGELSEFGTAPDPATAHWVRSLALPGRELALCRHAATQAHVHGACIGSGIEFPAFAQTLSAHPDTHFQLPELRFGLIPGAGGCVSISRRIGRQRTAAWVLSGKRIPARTALAWGLIDRITDA